MKALILTNGDYGDYSFCRQPEAYALIVCADNGMRHARHLGMRPHLIIGDFDSCSQEDRAYFVSEGVEMVQVPAEKDETDTELALLYALQRGATEIDVYGGLGSRMDHSMANMQLVYRLLQQGVPVTLYSGKNQFQLVKDCVTLYGEAGKLVSMMPFSACATGVTTTGLAYEVTDITLSLGDAFGVSNYMLGKKATITLKSGIIAVLLSTD